MTALAGYWSFVGSARAPVEACERMLRAQQIYARSSAAIISYPGVVLGRRLFATLPEDIFDRGPITGAGGRWTLVADVRLDARSDLCEELSLDPAQSKTMADSAIVMRAIERWHGAALERLVGEFSIILWDAHEQRMTLARDFLGQRPLHYHRGKDYLAIASMPKGLHGLPEIPREPNDETMKDFLALLPEHESNSYFREIERVLPGEALIITPTVATRSSIWNFQPTTLHLAENEYVEALRESFDRAVESRIRGARDAIGVQLSGGLDSGSVCATAARQLAPGGKVIAFTAAPREGFSEPLSPGRFNDESEHAAEVAGLYSNIEHVILRGKSLSPLSSLDRNFYLYDRPVLNLCNNLWVHEILDRCQKRGVNVLLTGLMGNHSISYSGIDSLADQMANGRFIRVISEMALLRRNGVRLRTSAAEALGPFLPRSVWRAINHLFGRHSGLSDASAVSPIAAEALMKKAAARGTDFSYQPKRYTGFIRKAELKQVDFGNYQKGFLGGWGVDVRDPTADRRLIELCLSIPPSAFLKDGHHRFLARKAFVDRLPAMVLDETRKGYQSADWHEGLCGDIEGIEAEVARIADLPGVDEVLDTRRLQDLLANRASVRWESRPAENEYRLALLRGISAGHFLRRAKGAN